MVFFFGVLVFLLFFWLIKVCYNVCLVMLEVINRNGVNLLRIEGFEKYK